MKDKKKFSKDKNFGITLSIIFLIIYFFSLDNLKFQPNNYLFISSLFLIISFIKPNLLNLLNFIVFKIGLVFMKLVSNLNIFIIYFIIFGSVALIMKLFRYDPLFIKNINKASSFWKKRNKNYDDMKSMKDQF